MWILLLGLSSLAAFADVEYLPPVQVLDHHGSGSLLPYVPSVIKLKEKDLQKKRQNSIGDTLQNEAGVTSTSFGPNSSRPVIRGLDGARIKTLQNGLNILDASTQSLDHAIPVDPLIVDEIEIVRGPMGVLYGSGAVGGVVNIVTNRIHSEFQEGKVIEVQSQGESVNSGLSHSLRADYGQKNWMLHLDGSTKNLEDQRIPGHAASRYAREQDPTLSGRKNHLKNSALQQDSLGTGATRFFSKGSVGLSYNHFRSDYGTVVEEDVTIDMQQNRFEFIGEYKPDGAFKKITLKSAQTGYRHRELEDGFTGTIFKNDGNETRLEAFNEAGEVKGVVGIQSVVNTFSAVGDEAFLPKVQNQQFSLFSFQELTKGTQSFAAGFRVENSNVDKHSSAVFGSSDEFNFTAANGSLGHTYRFSAENSLASTYSYTERPPTFQELLAGGVHVATGSFEQGDTGLKKEKSHGFELSFKHLEGKKTLTLGTYAQFFDNYISLNPTGADDLSSGTPIPIYAYESVSAVLYGIDMDAKTELVKLEKGELLGTTKFDLVRGKNRSSGDNLPRLSPPRLSFGSEYQRGNWGLDAEVQHVFDQTKTAENERRTAAYTLTNIGTQYTIPGSSSKLDLFLRFRNIFDVEARSHVSFLKELAPLPGRNIVAGLHWLL